MRTPLFFSLVLCALVSGCASLPQKAAETAEVGAAGNERYHVLAQKAFDGTAVFAKDGLEPISSEDWESTPKSVRVLVGRLADGLNANRFAFYSIAFQLNEGPDPATLKLDPIKIPEIEDESAGLLDGNGDGH